MNDTRDQRALRASDADRDRIAEVLRSAAADGRLSLTELEERIDALYSAKTYGELEPVIHDLPGEVIPASYPLESGAIRPPARSGRIGGTAGATETKVVFGGTSRRGEWVVPTRYRVKAIFGGVELDLREARLESHEVAITIKAVFGGVNIVVPDDIRVIVDGSAVFGGFDDSELTSQPGAGAPVVHVGGKAVFGGVSVQRKPTGRS